jgi:putative flippase GtrA
MTFIRYVIIQLLAYVVDMMGFILILKFDIFGSIIANVIGKSLAGVFGFIAHRNYTFGSNDRADKKRQAIRYFAVLALNIPISTGILSVFLNWINEPVIAKFLADCIVVGLSYLLSKHFIFTRL